MHCCIKQLTCLITHSTGKKNQAPAAAAAEEEDDDEDNSGGTEEAKNEEDVDESAGDTNPQDDQDEDPDGVAEIEERINTMTVGTKPPAKASSQSHSLAFWFPYLMYNYIDGRHHKITVDFIVIGMSRKLFRPGVKPGGKTLQLSCELPRLFTHQGRVQMANEVVGSDRFNDSTHKATAFEQACAPITDPLAASQPIVSEPQEVTLPFAVEDEIESWEVQAFDNDDQEFADEMAPDDWDVDVDGPAILQKYFILTVNMVGKKVRKQHVEGAIRKFGSPTRNNTRAAVNNNNNNGGGGGGEMVTDDE